MRDEDVLALLAELGAGEDLAAAVLQEIKADALRAHDLQQHYGLRLRSSPSEEAFAEETPLPRRRELWRRFWREHRPETGDTLTGRAPEKAGPET